MLARRRRRQVILAVLIAIAAVRLPVSPVCAGDLFTVGDEMPFLSGVPAEACEADCGAFSLAEWCNGLEGRVFSTNGPRFRGQLDADALWIEQSRENEETFGEIPDAVGLRRAWIGLQGEFAPDTRYLAAIDMTTGVIKPRDFFIGWGRVQESGELRAGHFREPFSLEGGTISSSFPFMEHSPINQLDPARNWGLSYFRCSPEETATLAVGVFHSGADSFDIQSDKDSETALTTRGTLLPWQDATGRQLVHLGIALSSRFPIQDSVILNQNPRSPLLNLGDSSTSPFVPRIEIPSNFRQLFNAQTAWVNGPLSLQGEWYGAWIDQKEGSPVFFHGSYAQVSYFLTGEQRSYRKQSGAFGGVTVERPIMRPLSYDRRVTETGAGAWEVIARCSYLDYFDSDTPKGPNGELVGLRMTQVTWGVNWYLTDHLRMMFNYSLAAPDEPNTGSSRASLFSSRLEVSW